jgi:hypothetical protein
LKCLSIIHIYFSKCFPKKIIDTSLFEENFGNNSKNIFPENKLDNSTNLSQFLLPLDLGEKNMKFEAYGNF